MKKIMIKNPVLVRFGMILVLALAISSIVSSFFSWKPDAAGKCGDDGKRRFP